MENYGPKWNPVLIERLEGIRNSLLAAHQTSAPMSNVTKGHEREAVIGEYLAKVFPYSFRFGTGEIIDVSHALSGQLDIVIEYPFAPSLPALVGSKSRLYLAENTVAVIEVKSDVSAQWSEVERTAQALHKIRRNPYDFVITEIGPTIPETIPLYVVAFKGWKTHAKTIEKLRNTPEVTGLLVLDDPRYWQVRKDEWYEYDGASALWALICQIQKLNNSLIYSQVDLWRYMDGNS